ncbi:hypothetical protein ACFYXL_14610 [Streptomyces tsukubensis]|uniref:hypothetical protein n=1 Tax=Streptomyces tsukubensis TaxID=83656 RepID=UPI0036890BA1
MCDAISRSRGRRIELRAFALPSPGPLGLWCETPTADLIVFQKETTPLHQDHIVLHEVGHILADHPGPGLSSQLATALPGLKPAAVHRVLQRCSYDSDQEREAELVATIIMEWASVLDEVSTPPSEDPSVQRVHAALGDRQGWQ